MHYLSLDPQEFAASASTAVDLFCCRYCTAFSAGRHTPPSLDQTASTGGPIASTGGNGGQLQALLDQIGSAECQRIVDVDELRESIANVLGWTRTMRWESRDGVERPQ